MKEIMKKGKRKSEEDIRIEPQIVDDELLFYFTPKAVEFFNIDKTSEAYHFSEHLINTLLEKYKTHPGKIGLVGDDIQTIKISMTMILQGYDEYIRTAFLRDIIPYQLSCHPKSVISEDPSPEQVSKQSLDTNNM